jgi:hypothetical protein
MTTQLVCDECGAVTAQGLGERVGGSRVAMPGESVNHWKPDGKPCQGVWRERETADITMYGHPPK